MFWFIVLFLVAYFIIYKNIFGFILKKFIEFIKNNIDS